MEEHGSPLTLIGLGSGEQGVRPDLLPPVGARLEEGVAAGHRGEDLSALVGLLA